MNFKKNYLPVLFFVISLKKMKEGKLLEKLKNAFLEFFKNDKQTLAFRGAQVIIGFLFWIGILLPYIVSSSLVNGSLSSAALPAGTLYTILFLGLIILFCYFVLIKKDKEARKTFLIQAVIATLIYLYSLVFNKVGLPDANNGFGKILQFLMVIMFWFFIFGKKYVQQIFSKIFPQKVIEPLAEVEQ